MLARVLVLSLAFLLTRDASGCDLCAVYNADSASGQSGKGLSLNISEQFIPYRTVQLDGEKLTPSILDDMYLDRSMTHIVPTWNFSDRFGVSLSLPVIYQSFRQMLLLAEDPFLETRSGQEAGIGDLALVGRCTVLRILHDQVGLTASVLAGVKFPTGDPEHLREEVALARKLDELYGTGHQHAISGVHLRDLTFGSGSYDGVFGVTVNSRWRRLFCNAQFQYYLRTPGESNYEFGDELMVSGGPGVFLFLNEAFSLSVQALAVYDVMESDILLGRENRNTGMTAIYLGPQVSLTLGQRISAIAGADLPIDIDNDGLQNVPDYRVHAGFSFRF